MEFNHKFLTLVGKELYNPDEICGNLVLDPDGKLISYDITHGKADKTGRKMCATHGDTSHIFHTHPAGGKFYPSPEDLWKVVKAGPVNVSFIFTEFGMFKLERILTEYVPTKQELVELNKIITNEVSLPLYEASQRGRIFKPHMRGILDEYIAMIEEGLPIKIEFFMA